MRLGDEIVNVNGSHLRGIRSFDEIKRLLHTFVNDSMELVIAHDEITSLTDFYTKIKIGSHPMVANETNCSNNTLVPATKRASLANDNHQDDRSAFQKRMICINDENSSNSTATDSCSNSKRNSQIINEKFLVSEGVDVDNMPPSMPLMQHRRTSTPRHSLDVNHLENSRRRTRSSSGQRNLELNSSLFIKANKTMVTANDYTPVYSNRSASLPFAVTPSTISDDDKWKLTQCHHKRFSEDTTIINSINYESINRLRRDETIQNSFDNNDITTRNTCDSPLLVNGKNGLESNSGNQVQSKTECTTLQYATEVMFPARLHYTRNSMNLTNSHYRSLRFAHSRLSGSRLSLFHQPLNSPAGSLNNIKTNTINTNNSSVGDSSINNSFYKENKKETTNLTGDLNIKTTTNDESNNIFKTETDLVVNDGNDLNNCSRMNTASASTKSSNIMSSKLNTQYPINGKIITLGNGTSDSMNTTDNNTITATTDINQISPAPTSIHRVTIPSIVKDRIDDNRIITNPHNSPKHSQTNCSSIEKNQISFFSTVNGYPRDVGSNNIPGNSLLLGVSTATNKLQIHRASLPVPKLTIRDEEMAEVIKASITDGKRNRYNK